jgi:hypothetical protein
MHSQAKGKADPSHRPYLRFAGNLVSMRSLIHFRENLSHGLTLNAAHEVRQLYLYCAFNTRGRLRVLHVETLSYNKMK